ncbi:MAG: 30S ribosomal protein S8 [Elusimicrobia bacterium]|jgi:small subunit ribosomal protein S8|nr:30S ribosomal protein S8 [Elusimicrobiota bacterium]MBK7207289.1 30S ribosomal protein S8 [Elusimicrobiota bacterium]MBK7546102.1 30S ribosomal protein S8 [Elusimicrobiota bacterium]MBK7575449.1 30S ribosomal protein S8 [Elusimicrobiota bacterium]MBK7689161.1 30S ribosomal protein S8 [Elusimicrobiota bacterium]
MTSDPISDMLAAITNANHKLKERVDLPASALKKEVAQVLKDEGYIVDYKVLPDRKQGVLRLFLKYLPNKTRVLQGVKRVSRPGLRVYRGYEELPKLRGGLGMSIVSTSKGLMTDRRSRKEKLGGEVLAQVW